LAHGRSTAGRSGRRRSAAPGRRLPAPGSARAAALSRSSPLRIVAAAAQPALEVEAEKKERHHFGQRDEAVDGVAGEGRGIGKADHALIEAAHDGAIELDVLAPDKHEGGAED